MSRTSLETIELIIRTMSEVALENRSYFCELDGVVGDGDLGNNGAIVGDPSGELLTRD